MSSPAADAPSPAAVRRLVVGLLPAIFLGAIDGQIVPVALLTIGRALGDATLIAWVMAGYLVAGTVVTPIYGKLSDLHGRRRMLLAALAVSVVGSAACALAVSMPALIGGRVLQGLGSGALFALAQAAAADVISGPERGRYQGYFSAVFATAALAAPLLGGFLTTHLSWRAVFWVNLPLAALAAWQVRRVVAPAPSGRVRAPIDGWGAALLAAGLGITLIALTRVGQGAGWLSASTLGLVALGVVLLAGWAWREADAPEPIVPLSLFANRRVLAACVVTALNFFVLIGCTVLLPLSMQTVGDARADEVALRLVALTLATPLGAFTAGRLMLARPMVGAIAAAGCAIASAGLLALAWTATDRTPPALAAMAALGYGLGMTLPAVLVAAQGAVGPALIGVVTSLVAFFRSLGGVIGIAVLTSIVLASTDGASIVDAPREPLAQAFRWAFGVAAGASAIAAAVAFTLGNVGADPAPAPGAGPPDATT